MKNKSLKDLKEVLEKMCDGISDSKIDLLSILSQDAITLHHRDQAMAECDWTVKKFDKALDLLLDEASKGMKKPKNGWTIKHYLKIAVNMEKILKNL